MAVRKSAMFHTEVRPAAGRGLLVALSVLLTAILIATFATLWAAVVIRREQRDISALARQTRGRAGTLVEQWRDEQSWQLVSLAGDFIILWASGVALVLVWRSLAASQRSLREVASLAADILASVDQGVVTTDDDACITSLNPKAVELLNLKPEQQGAPLMDVPLYGDALRRLTRRVLASAAPIRDADLCSRDSPQYPVLRADGTLLHDSQGEVAGVVLHIRDVTERVLMEERMHRMERYMELGALAAGLHHEIRNPLAALSLHVQLLEEDVEQPVSEDFQESLAVLKSEIARISGVLESFRDFASQQRLDLQPVRVADLLQRVVELVRPQAEQRRVRIRIASDAPPDLSAPLDSMRMQQVLLNLIVNSLEAMVDGGDLTLAAQTAGRELQIRVEDTGPGVPDNVRQRIFDPYFTTKPTGTGMGLAMCEKIVRQHGGRIHCRSDATGACFSITLPLAGDAEDHA